ncbi:winged helix-turn-helix domain-containing protein [Pseudomonas aeruginosa]|uniref:winged helix-turn-helix domain-containing tetratricopeptide repeat protein n=1 Tax=Pseudomonas aeruginosa TaxID=287 RepID=UPI000FF44600|nr:winged helix-turn-helix domain-containing protein [Pseudomonas aeruginosa]MBA5082337.1 winged helix-turn-helix domain-containing protein [Pseudomonas aeruginosa]MDI2269069.1 winged helix-turn-helix domain-containing protein [Pseudomonas aeruginosa]MDI2280782.1 winged helix-turn-helix domain-containing protein [Pseudomonas aeruginosa]MDI2288579.1 winged helix-turn-helix domain-containing protein [Pseudomonas aeruginosa]RPO17668.1 CadC-family transcriptional regulator [Pseudomonas aeruginosa]
MPFEFGDYVLDQERRELTLCGQAVVVGPQVFDLLLHLVRNHDHVVSKDDLLKVVWNGRIVSESTITSHINAVRKAVGDSGEEQRLVRTVPRKGYRFVGALKNAGPGLERQSAWSDLSDAVPLVAKEGTPPALDLPDKPSITVLPFQNLSGNPDEDYFADGVVEDIIAALSRIRWLFVIARNSSFTYKGRAVDVRGVGQELGVRYVLEGSLRRSGNKVRITGQLIDATSGAHLWAERFEGLLDDIFELQDRIAESVVGAIAPQLERAEIERAKRKPTESLGAYDYYLRGTAKLHTGTREAIEEALRLFYTAIELDPEFASAYGMAAWCHFWRKLNGWMQEPAREIAEGERLARLAVELGRDDAVALTRGGHALGHLAGDVDGGIALLDRARLLNPNLAPAWYLGGILRALRGETETAIEDLLHATRLSPLDPEMFRMQVGMALAHFFAGRFDDSAEWAEKALGNLPSLLAAAALLAASHALAGRADEARRAMGRLRALDSSLRLSQLLHWLPIKRPEDLARLATGLRLAGLPE